ncbi:MAG: DUF2294 domain-containing protein [Leptolyngbyaceae cyanobacterium]
MPTTTTLTTTRGQTQRALSQKIQKVYKNQLGHSPGKVACQIVDDKIMLVVEDSLTKVEKFLIQGDKDQAGGVKTDVERVRADLDTAVRPLLVEVIEAELSSTVVDILSDTTLETGRTAIVVILGNVPTFAPNGGKAE